MNQPPRRSPIASGTLVGLPPAGLLPGAEREESGTVLVAGEGAGSISVTPPGESPAEAAPAEPLAVTADAPPSEAGEGPEAPAAHPSIAPPSRVPDPYIGTTIDGRYRVDSVLGEGGMGIVYLGRHKVINKRVAIKILRADLSRDHEMLDRFLQEARAASSIGHPHIVDVSDFGELPDGAAYFAMEYLEGRSLTSLFHEGKPLPTARILHIGKQVADALAATHRQEIVHRDMKPDNIFLVERGLEKDFVKILDFGIAKVSSSNTAKLTRAGTVFGTPHYMSPEQAAGAPVDHRTDIYAVGVILYEMATGKVPFDADNYMGILTQHMYKAPVPIRMLVPSPAENIPPGLEAIIQKALLKKPEQRYQSMGELMEDLDRVEKGQIPLAVNEMMARSGSFNVPVDYFNNSALSDMVPATPSAAPKRWGIYAGIASVLTAVAVVVGVLVHGSTSTAQSSPAPSAPPAKVEAPAPTPSAAVTPVPPVVAAPAAKAVLVGAIPTDAEVFQDGKSLGVVPVSVSVPDGQTVTIEVRRDSYAPQTITLDGKAARDVVKLKALGRAGPLPGAPAGKPGGGSKPRGDIVDPWSH